MSIYFYEEHSKLSSRNPVWGDIREHDIDDMLHLHENIEIIYIYSGSCEVFNGGEVINLSEGDTCVVSSRAIHGLRCAGSKSKNAYFILSEKFCVEMGFFTNSTVFQKKIKDQRLTDIFLRIDKEFHGSDDYCESALKIELLSVLLILFREYATCRALESTSPKVALTKAVMGYIREHYMHEITMEALEEHCTYSRFYISRVFKETSGKSVVSYLNEVRMSHARRMLENTSMPVSDIAAATGFESQSYFGKVFRRAVGMSPLEYRAEKSDTPRG